MTIKINPNSDCAGELDALKELLPKNKSYTFGEWSYAAIIISSLVRIGASKPPAARYASLR
jgi:hypothetical protein